MGYVPDKLKKAEKRIRAQSYDTEAWSVLIRDSQVFVFFHLLHYISILYYYYFVDTTAGGLFVPYGFICTLLSALTLT